MFRLAIKQWSITVGLIWILLAISAPSTMATQESAEPEWWENIKLSQEAKEVLFTWKDYLRLMKAVEE